MNNLRLILGLIIGWLIPGSGYWVIGKRLKAVLLFSFIMFLFIGGILLADLRDIRFNDNPYYYVGRFGSGLIWLVFSFFLKLSPAGIMPVQYFDIGHLYICVAGSLNLVILINMITQVSPAPLKRDGEEDQNPPQADSDAPASVPLRQVAEEATDILLL